MRHAALVGWTALYGYDPIGGLWMFHVRHYGVPRNYPTISEPLDILMASDET